MEDRLSPARALIVYQNGTSTLDPTLAIYEDPGLFGHIETHTFSLVNFEKKFRRAARGERLRREAARHSPAYRAISFHRSSFFTRVTHR